MRKTVAVILALAAVLACFPVYAGEGDARLPVRVLLFPKFEVEKISGDFPGEAQFYYEQYLEGAEKFTVPYTDGGILYYRDGVAMFVLGMGKVNAAMGVMAVLMDSRFDFSGAYIISTGCGGSAAGSTVMGDVFIITAVVDYDLGHHADSRDIAEPGGTTWFHDDDYESAAVAFLDPGLMEKVYALVKDVPLETTEATRSYMSAAFGGAEWAVRDPAVQRGTSVTGDNYWKGEHGQNNAVLMAETYGCPDPFVITEMEDVAVARAAERMGMLDRLIIIRDSVNMAVFMNGSTPESLWGKGSEPDVTEDGNAETADIFATAMENNFRVGRILIDLILAGEF